MLQQYLEAGRIVGTHGVKGELRIEPWCDSAEFLSQFRTLYWDPNGTSAVKVPGHLPGRKNVSRSLHPAGGSGA